jgi:PhzF family phenazine biosynthesis protein
MGLKITQVDSFTDRPFAGNPAGVCILEQAAPEDWMQRVAAEMNLSETAFLYRESDGYRIRWFTPVSESPLCGHATLASAHVLWQDGMEHPEQAIRFFTKSGLLEARRADGWIELDFPVIPHEQVGDTGGLAGALGVTPVYIGKSRNYYFIETDSESRVRGLTPNLSLIAQLPVRGVVVTARAETPEFDFVSRYFAPAVGVPEDPVTGSVHCMLTPYWAGKLGKTVMQAYQASKRGGVVRVRLAGDRVVLGGRAVTVMRCELT